MRAGAVPNSPKTSVCDTGQKFGERFELLIRWRDLVDRHPFLRFRIAGYRRIDYRRNRLKIDAFRRRRLG